MYINLAAVQFCVSWISGICCMYTSKFKLCPALSRSKSVTALINFMFIGPCIIIYSYSTANKMHLLSQIIYSCKNAPVVSDGLSVNHQELKTVYTATVYVKQLIGDEMELVKTSSISSPIAAGSSSCLTYTVAVYAVLSSR
jgi:hypothetical protein